MLVQMTASWAPGRGRRTLRAGEVVEVNAETAADLIRRGLALPVAAPVERATAPGQRG